jgi:hypothetical protein
MCDNASNQAAAADAPIAFLLAIVRPSWRAAAQRRSAAMRAERAKAKSRRDDMKVALGQRGTSAALGERYNMISSLFSNLVWRARAPNQIGKKRGWVGCDLPRAAASRLHPITARQAAASPWAIILSPLPGLRPSRRYGQMNRRPPE